MALREVPLTYLITISVVFTGGASGKESACKCRRCKRRGFDPWVGKIPWRRKWQPTAVLLPGKSHDRGAWRATVRKRWTQLSDLAYVRIRLICFPRTVAGVRDMII